jgi:murein DD-endopeptidase MepM/ murein hydrolase activator NlpD
MWNKYRLRPSTIWAQGSAFRDLANGSNVGGGRTWVNGDRGTASSWRGRWRGLAAVGTIMAPLVAVLGCATGNAGSEPQRVIIGEGPDGPRSLLLKPVAAGELTSEFGARLDPLNGSLRYHEGVDYGAPIGTPVLAAGDGLVMQVAVRRGYGNYVLVRHDDVHATSYAHMARFAEGLHPGQRVEQGQVIGQVGASGRASGPHLHYEMLVDGKPVDPLGVSFDLAQLKGRAVDAAGSFWVGLNGVGDDMAGAIEGHVLEALDQLEIGLRGDDCAPSCDPAVDPEPQ